MLALKDANAAKLPRITRSQTPIKKEAEADAARLARLSKSPLPSGYADFFAKIEAENCKNGVRTKENIFTPKKQATPTSTRSGRGAGWANTPRSGGVIRGRAQSVRGSLLGSGGVVQGRGQPVRGSLIGSGRGAGRANKPGSGGVVRGRAQPVRGSLIGGGGDSREGEQ